MRTEVARDLSDSAHDFLHVVWPAIQSHLQGGRMEPVETSAIEPSKKDLDVLAGIDAWQMIDTKGVMRGIASRIQWSECASCRTKNAYEACLGQCKNSWDTFTIRLDRENGTKTEYEKRMTAYMAPDGGWLIPTITVQAYLTRPRRGGRLIRAGIAYTRDLLEYSLRFPCTQPRRNGEDGVLFNWYSWSGMRKEDYRVTVVSAPFGDANGP